MFFDTWGEFVANQPIAAGAVAAIAGGTVGTMIGLACNEIVVEIGCRKVRKERAAIAGVKPTPAA